MSAKGISAALTQRRYASRLYRDLAREGTRCLCSSLCAYVPLCLDSDARCRSSGIKPKSHTTEQG